MKNLKYSIAFLAVFALLFTSCSKEESGIAISEQDTFQLQFGSLLNDFSNKQSKIHDVDPMECTEGTPSFVRVAITDSDGIYVGNAGGTTTPSAIQVNLKNNNDSWETMYSEELGLPAGDYTLQYFVVYSADEEVLWVAPREGGDFAGSVSEPLPQEITLGAGTKPYISVDVLCYVPRVEVAYGYIFFDINFIPIENNYCIFVNYCDNTSGREYPANFQVDIWTDGYGGTDMVVDGVMNTVSGTGNNFAATVLCLPLSPLGVGEVYYVRVSIVDAAPYNSDNTHFAEFTVSQAEIEAQLLEVPAYEHVRINCADDDGNGECDLQNPELDCDNDGVLNGDDLCEGFDDKQDLDKDKIPDACDDDRDGDGILNGPDLCPDTLQGEGYVDADLDGCNDSINPPVSCIPAVPSGCERFSDTYSKDGSGIPQIENIAIGDLTLEFTDGGLFVGLTPIVPNEFSHIEVTIGDTVVCMEGVIPAEGGSTTIPGWTAADAPFNIGLKVNFCNVQE